MSPMARTRRGRLRQCEAWLKSRYPTPLPVTVRVVDIATDRKCIAETIPGTRRIIIEIHKHLKWAPAIDCLLHEFGHAVTWRSKDPKHHGPEFAATYGRIYSDWFDSGGAEESRTL